MPTDIDLAGLGIRAVSVGGLETCIEVPSFKLCFDIGKCPDTAARLPTVLFTHGHPDHLGGLIHHVSAREMRGSPPPTYVVPAEIEDGVNRMLELWRGIAHTELPCTVIGARPGDRISVGGGRFARAFRAIHRVPCLGWGIEVERRSLTEAWRGRSSAEIQAGLAGGEPVHEITTHTEIVFCGDTTADVIDRELVVRTARRLVLEVTFLDERVERKRARTSGHVHLEDVVERADLLQNEAILFTHASERYAGSEIVARLSERLPAGLRERAWALVGREAVPVSGS